MLATVLRIKVGILNCPQGFQSIYINLPDPIYVEKFYPNSIRDKYGNGGRH